MLSTNKEVERARRWFYLNLQNNLYFVFDLFNINFFASIDARLAFITDLDYKSNLKLPLAPCFTRISLRLLFGNRWMPCRTHKSS